MSSATKPKPLEKKALKDIYEKTCGIKIQVPASATLEQIEDYATKVLKGLIACLLPPCHRCGLEPHRFKRHEALPRKFHGIGDVIGDVA